MATRKISTITYKVHFSDKALRDGDFIKAKYKGIEQLMSPITTVDSEELLSIESLMELFQGTPGISHVEGKFKV